MIVTENIYKNLNLTNNSINERKFNKLFCTFYKNNDLEFLNHNNFYNIIDKVIYKKETNQIFYRGNEKRNIIKINYFYQQNMLLHTFYHQLSNECDMWIQLAFENNFKIEFYE